MVERLGLQARQGITSCHACVAYLVSVTRLNPSEGIVRLRWSTIHGQVGKRATETGECRSVDRCSQLPL